MQIFAIGNSQNLNKKSYNTSFSSKNTIAKKALTDKEIIDELKKITAHFEELKINPKKELEFIKEQMKIYENKQAAKQKAYVHMIKTTDPLKVPLGPATANSWEEHFNNVSYYNGLKARAAELEALIKAKK